MKENSFIIFSPFKSCLTEKLQYFLLVQRVDGEKKQEKMIEKEVIEKVWARKNMNAKFSSILSAFVL